MKLERKQKTWITLGIAALFILYGFLDMIFKFNINPKTVSNVGMVLMIVAFALIFSGRKPKQNSSDETNANSSTQDTPNQIETNSSIQDTVAQIETNDNGQDNDSGTDNTTQTETIEQENQVEQTDDPNAK